MDGRRSRRLSRQSRRWQKPIPQSSFLTYKDFRSASWVRAPKRHLNIALFGLCDLGGGGLLCAACPASSPLPLQPCFHPSPKLKPLPDVLIAGQTREAIGAVGFGARCYLNKGFSTFQRNGSSLKAVISFAEIVDQSSFDLGGQATMTFASPTSGNIHFKQTPALPANVKDPPFSNYSETYNATAKQLVVQFSITFPDCTLPIYAVYDRA
jgi:hypothetical protein